MSECGKRVNGFVVTEPEKPFADTGEPIISARDFKSRYKHGKTGLIITLNSDYYDEILPNLQYAWDDIYFLKEKYKQLALNRFLSGGNEDNLHISYLIASHCNITCYSCFLAAPIAKKRFIDARQVIADFARLNELTDLKGIGLGGGAFTPPAAAVYLKISAGNISAMPGYDGLDKWPFARAAGRRIL